MAQQEPRPGFFRRVGRFLTTLRVVLSNLFFVLGLLFLLYLLFGTRDETLTVPDGAALVLELDGPVVEEAPVPDPLSLLFQDQDAPRPIALRDLTETLERAAEDGRIRALVLDVSRFPGTAPATLSAVGRALETFKDSGKPVIVGADRLSQAQYYLASHADQLYLNPAGQLIFTGFAIQPVYFAEALEKLRVQVHVFREGVYKSAVEPFLRDDMSEEDREANRALVQGLWQEWRDTVARNRGLEPARLDALVNEYPDRLRAVDGDPARLALETGLVDELLPRDAVRARLADLVGTDPDGGSFLAVGHRRYLRNVRLGSLPEGRDERPRIAVVVAEGTIAAGTPEPGGGTGEPTVRLIREAREDDDVRAIVLRVNSPGGTPFFSEVVRRELELAQVAGKPVVASLGGVAASGGYWIAATADRIVADASTITGSIGVFGVTVRLQDSADALGVHSDGVGTHRLSGAGNPFQPLNPALEDILTQQVAHSYRRFVDLVARGREMDPEDVDAVAQGRVWLARTAAEIGLVDELGGVELAVERAAELAGLERWRVDYAEPPRSPAQQLLERLAGGVAATSLVGALDSPTLATLRRLSRWADESTRWLELLAEQEPGTWAMCLGCPGTVR